MLNNIPSETLAEWINTGHSAIKMAVRRLAIHVAQVGAWLVAAKNKCQHGEWLDWLAMNCLEISHDTATRYMKVYDKMFALDKTNYALVRNLTPKEAYRYLGIVKDPTDREVKVETIKTLYPPIIYQESYEKFLDRFDNQSVDLLLTDPPYMTDVDDIYEFAHWVELALARRRITYIQGSPAVRNECRIYGFWGQIPPRIPLRWRREKFLDKYSKCNV